MDTNEHEKFEPGLHAFRQRDLPQAKVFSASAIISINSCLFVFIRGCNGLNGQTQNKTTAPALARFKDHITAMGTGDLSRNREAQPRTLDAPAQRITGAEVCYTILGEVEIYFLVTNHPLS